MNHRRPDTTFRTSVNAVAMVLFFLALSGTFGVNAHGARSCPDLFKEKTAMVSKQRFDLRPALPERGSAAYIQIVESIREQFLAKSYAVVNLESIFTEALGKSWYLSMPHKVGSQISRDEFLYESPEGRVAESISQDHKRSIAATKEWFSVILQDAIQFRSGSSYASVRLSTATEKTLNLEMWHPDGGTAVVTLAPFGPGTEGLGAIPKGLSMAKAPTTLGGHIDWLKVCQGCRPFIVPRGHALIFMGTQDRSPEPIFSPLIHRTPLEFGERVLFVFRFD